MARKRGQKLGHLCRKGPSWVLRYREDARAPDGSLTRVHKAEVIAPAEGEEALSKRQARRLADERLQQVDRRNTSPPSLMTIEEFVRTKFETQVLWKLKPAGRKHYEYLFRKLLPAIGKRRLCDFTIEDVEMLVRDFRDQGFSGQTVLHLKNAVSAVFRHAKRLRFYREDNPASGVEVGEVQAEKRPTFTWERARLALAALKTPYREMALLSVATSMNVAELCGLRQKHANLTHSIQTVDGEILAPYSIAVRENWYEGERGSLKATKRRRNLPITPELAAMLRQIIRAARQQDPEAPLFQAGTGNPIDAHNVSNRHFRPLSVKLGYSITWHAFRRAHSSFAGQIEGVSLEDRVRTMGHADAAMTLAYSIEDIERRRRLPEQIMARLMGEPEGGVQ